MTVLIAVLSALVIVPLFGVMGLYFLCALVAEQAEE